MKAIVPSLIRSMLAKSAAARSATAALFVCANLGFGSLVSAQASGPNCRFFPEDGRVHCGSGCTFFPQDGRVHCAAAIGGSCVFFPQDGRVHCGYGCDFFPQDGRVHCANEGESLVQQSLKSSSN